MNKKTFLFSVCCLVLFAINSWASSPTPYGKWGYFISDEYDDSTWSMDLEISNNRTDITVKCEWNGQTDEASLSVPSQIQGHQLIFENDAIAKGKKGCDYEVYAGPTTFKVTISSLIFLDQQNRPFLVFYRK